MLKIIHRVNTINELKNVKAEYGVEIDVRNYAGKLILHHEPFKRGDYFEDFCAEFDKSFLILNIKTEGIEEDVLSKIRKYNIKNYFLLDVSFPFIIKLIKTGEKKIAVRFSEFESIETVLSLEGMVEWVWIDIFNKLPLDKDSFIKLKNAGFKICLVSPEILMRPEEIESYKKYLKENNIEIEAVMTSQEYADMW